MGEGVVSTDIPRLGSKLVTWAEQVVLTLVS
jgi:hypothetical protein